MNREEILITMGVNIPETMERFMNNEELYLKFLKKLEQDDNFVQLQTSIQVADYDGAVQYSHTLKGVTGNLGLNPLYQLLGQMVNLLRAGETAGLPALCEQIKSEYEKTCQLIAQL